MNAALHHTLAVGKVASPDVRYARTPHLWRLWLTLRSAFGRSDGASPVNSEKIVGGWLGDCRPETPEGARQQAGLVVQGR